MIILNHDYLFDEQIFNLHKDPNIDDLGSNRNQIPLLNIAN